MLPSSHYSDIIQNFHISDREQYPPQIFLSSACQPVSRPVQESQRAIACSGVVANSSKVQYSTVQYSTVKPSHAAVLWQILVLWENWWQLEIVTSNHSRSASEVNGMNSTEYREWGSPWCGLSENGQISDIYVVTPDKFYTRYVPILIISLIRDETIQYSWYQNKIH